MKRLLACMVAAVMLCAVSAAVASAPSEAVTCGLGGGLDRVKLRAEPNTDADVLGQYFANVRFTVLETGGEWWRVRIGDREGYMMSRFLTAEIPAEGTFAEGQSGFVCVPGEERATWLYAAADTQAAVLGTVGGGALYVLGTVGENRLHVRYREDGGEPVTGYVSSADIAMAENYATVMVDTGEAASRLHLRAEPDRAAASLGLFYSGAVLYRLFDDHVNGDGWTRVRIGNSVGYMLDEYLSFSSDGFARFSAPLSGTRYASLPVFASPDAELAGDTVTNTDVFAVLGECGTRYCVQILTDLPNRYRYGYVEKKDVREVRASAGTGGTLKTEQALYIQAGNGEPEPSGLRAAAGAEVRITGSLSNPGFPYVDTGSAWLECLVETADGDTFALLPREAVNYDASLEY